MFQDRLVNETDRSWFDSLLRDFIEHKFEADPETVLGENLILYADCCNDSKAYERITNFDKVRIIGRGGIDIRIEDSPSKTEQFADLTLFFLHQDHRRAIHPITN